jgi:hypothetical protein
MATPTITPHQETPMADTIHITASLRMERPVEEVRAQYRDIDHHIRNNVHPSIRYEWEPSAPGERKIKTTFRILGVPQYDISLLEDAEDGSFVIRYLEGSNAGMVLVHKFVPLGPHATDVQLFADAPSSMGRKLLGPLFVAGARQVMKKALAEDKRDLEKGAFKSGTAAGDLDAALTTVAPLAARDPATKRLVLEAACLVSAADGEVDPVERDALERLVKLLGAESDLPWMTARIADLTKLAASTGIATEAERLGAWLKANDVAQPALVAAAVVGLVSQGMSLGELALLRRLAVAAGIADEEVGPVVERADSALSAVA